MSTNTSKKRKIRNKKINNKLCKFWLLQYFRLGNIRIKNRIKLFLFNDLRESIKMKPNNTNRKRNVSKLGRNLLSFDVVLAHFSGNLFKFDDVY